MDSEKAIKQLNQIIKLINKKELRLSAQWPKKWQILISTILSAQTRDEVTIKTCEVLFKKYKTPESLSKAKISKIERIIRRVNYHKTKSRNIIATSKAINQKGIPKNVEGLILLPGVGRKVANVYLAEAYKADVIGVDTHVGRISRKLSWTDKKNPYKVEKDLEKLFPKRYWRKINETLVKFGRIFGRSRIKEDEILKKINS